MRGLSCTNRWCAVTTNDNVHSMPFDVRVLLSEVLSTEQRVMVESAPAALKTNTCLSGRGTRGYLILSVAAE